MKSFGKLYILGATMLLICFLIPILGTIPFEEREKKEEKGTNHSIMQNSYDYKKYNKIKVLHSKTNQIEEMKLDDYLYGVVSAEMPADFEIEALKAQAVVARTYTIYKIIHNESKHGEASICDDSTCCQAWIGKEDRMARWEEQVRDSNWAKIVEAVNATQGKIITYQGEPINAFFHSNSGGETEAPVNVWGGTGYPYLQSVQTAGEDAYAQYASSQTFTKLELEEKIREKHPNFSIDWNLPDCIQILEYTEGGRVKTIKMGSLNLSGVEVRTLLGLRSANFSFSMQGDQITFTVKGYGHGVGMSQTGADSLAKQGFTYEQIIHHFYTNIEINNL